jgi:hypothetical protein
MHDTDLLDSGNRCTIQVGHVKQTHETTAVTALQTRDKHLSAGTWPLVVAFAADFFPIHLTSGALELANS